MTQITKMIDEQTDAANSDSFEVEANKPVTVVLHGALSEDVPIEMQLADGSWEEMVSADLILNGSLNAIQIVAAGVYRVAKPSTAGAVGATIYRY